MPETAIRLSSLPSEQKRRADSFLSVRRFPYFLLDGAAVQMV